MKLKGGIYGDTLMMSIQAIYTNGYTTSITPGLPLRVDGGSRPLRSSGVSDPHIILPSLDGEFPGLTRLRPVVPICER